jgi:hypothetical protein
VDIANCFYYFYHSKEDATQDVFPTTYTSGPQIQNIPPQPLSITDELDSRLSEELLSWKFPSEPYERDDLETSHQPTYSEASVRRKPVPLRRSMNAESGRAIQEATQPTGGQSVRRKPLGPRQWNQDHPHAQNKSSLNEKPVSKISSHQRVDGSTVVDPRLGFISPLSQEYTNGRRKSVLTSGSKLLMIRRDPFSGFQKTIGSIHIPAARRYSHDTSSDRHFSVDLDTLGYRKFLPAGETGAFERSVDFDSGHQSSEKAHHRNGSSVSFSQDTSPMGFSPWTRDNSSTIYGHGRSSSNSSTAFSPTKSSFSFDNVRPKNYVFTAPWGDICRFTTSGAGRKLRCNMLVPDQTPAFSQSPYFTHNAVPISELRFNLPLLPSSTPLSPRLSPPKLSYLTAALKKQTFLNKFKRPQPPAGGHSRAKSASELWFSGMTDAEPSAAESSFIGHRYTKSTEEGGGGFTGKDAKLGKLVVEVDGLQMLDLVVAVNMGIWWRGWEKSTR